MLEVASGGLRLEPLARRCRPSRPPIHYPIDGQHLSREVGVRPFTEPNQIPGSQSSSLPRYWFLHDRRYPQSTSVRQADQQIPSAIAYIGDEPYRHIQVGERWMARIGLMPRPGISLPAITLATGLESGGTLRSLHGSRGWRGTSRRSRPWPAYQDRTASTSAPAGGTRVVSATLEGPSHRNRHHDPKSDVAMKAAPAQADPIAERRTTPTMSHSCS